MEVVLLTYMIRCVLDPLTVPISRSTEPVLLAVVADMVHVFKFTIGRNAKRPSL